MNCFEKANKEYEKKVKTLKFNDVKSILIELYDYEIRIDYGEIRFSHNDIVNILGKYPPQHREVAMDYYTGRRKILEKDKDDFIESKIIQVKEARNYRNHQVNILENKFRKLRNKYPKSYIEEAFKRSRWKRKYK